MRISIALTTYNGTKNILEQLNSFLIQKRVPDELIICDDCSSDNTIEIIENFILNAPFFVRLHKNESNLGYVKNFEKALRLCSGDIIFLSDQDDVWEKDKLFICEEILKKNPKTQIIINDAVICNGDLSETKHTKIQQTLKLGMDVSKFITGCCCAIRKELLDIALPIPKEIAHDEWINGFGTIFKSRIVCDLPLQKYRRHENNASNNLTSSVKKISKFDTIKQFGLKDARDSWKRIANQYQLYINRLNEKEKLIRDWGFEVQATQSIQTFEIKISVINKRIQLVSLSRFQRLIPVLIFWLKGNYNYLEGWKSAVKDIIRK